MRHIGQRFSEGSVIIFDLNEYEKNMELKGDFEDKLFLSRQWFERDLKRKGVSGKYVIYKIIRDIGSESLDGKYTYDRVYVGKLDEENKKVIVENKDHVFRTDTFYDWAAKVVRNVCMSDFEICFPNP